MNVNNWRQREAEKVRARKEQERKLKEELEQKKIQKTEQNFPSVIPQTPQHSTTVFEKKFTALASNWKQEEEREKALALVRAQQEEKRANEFKGMYIFRPNNYSLNTIRVDIEEDYVEPPPVKRVQEDPDGWVEVKKKVRKQPKNLTERELAEKYNTVGRDVEEELGEHNSELFENNRHDHY